MTETPRTSLGRTIALWFGACFCVGILLFSFGGVPLFPIIAAGLVTLAITLARYYRSHKR